MSNARTRQEVHGWVFGDAIASFVPNIHPTKEAVIKLWMTVYDKWRVDYQLSTEEKDAVINNVVDALVANWHPTPVQPKGILKLKSSKKQTDL